ncbi:hypothetical protein ASPWEDRAFT_167587 [Aspergillus wentii DTO 134E9]|uniref:Uncharacterized protein n=1 Tax=Aspergillus wentii DTO 134E9 TaxID=1073089 RepID=A0A1L9S340_ASPWE|nr:uncharacterized protein ASPWEDRAFT_167587 [Aspergillus wentii DTO 134E9]KAI9929922.1 hypothetical protein MW887_011732 [Aspergillus wentii]OJJ41573.1 hypothetical protein ASPWEDRAFT_167587 [Aspergillus wentii DTO 134E9]
MFYNVKARQALFCLFLAVGPAAVFAAPFPAQNGMETRDYGSDTTTTTSTTTNTEAGANIGASIPDGPAYNTGSYFSNNNAESASAESSTNTDGSQNSASESVSESGQTTAGNNFNAGIPDGPSVDLGNYYSNSYDVEQSASYTSQPEQEEQAPPVPPADTPAPEPPKDTPEPTPEPQPPVEESQPPAPPAEEHHEPPADSCRVEKRVVYVRV